MNMVKVYLAQQNVGVDPCVRPQRRVFEYWRLSDMKRFALLLAVAMSMGCFAQMAGAYEFWGIDLGKAYYEGGEHITFDGVSSSHAGYSVGGYKYTRVDSVWSGPYAAASPGADYSRASTLSDAMGLFFRADKDAARFAIITGSRLGGATTPEMGTGTRRFGPGDLMINNGSATYGVGMRKDGLAWALDAASTNPEHQVIRPDGSYDDMHARDTGTLGDIEVNPEWARMGNAALEAGSDLASAFFKSGSGTAIGSAEVDFASTGVSLSGVGINIYTVSVPWTALRFSWDNYSFDVSWRPDCGNDIIDGSFTASRESWVKPIASLVPTSEGAMPSSVPEPSSVLALLAGTSCFGAIRLLRRC